MRAISRSPRSRSSAARVIAVGRPLATSCAKVGPERTATGEPGRTARATSCIKRPVPSSIPLAQSTSGWPPADKAERTARGCCAGVTTRNAWQCVSSARFCVARSVGLSGIPGRKRRFSWDVVMESTTSASRAQISVSAPSAAMVCARAVPQAPAPTIPIFMPSPPRRAPFPPRDRAASGRGPGRRGRRSGPPRT